MGSWRLPSLLDVPPRTCVEVDRERERSERVNPQSVAARKRRQRISQRLALLSQLIPASISALHKLDTSAMLDMAIAHVLFLRSQLRFSSNDVAIHNLLSPPLHHNTYLHQHVTHDRLFSPPLPHNTHHQQRHDDLLSPSQPQNIHLQQHIAHDLLSPPSPHHTHHQQQHGDLLSPLLHNTHHGQHVAAHDLLCPLPHNTHHQKQNDDHLSPPLHYTHPKQHVARNLLSSSLPHNIHHHQQQHVPHHFLSPPLLHEKEQDQEEKEEEEMLVLQFAHSRLLIHRLLSSDAIQGLLTKHGQCLLTSHQLVLSLYPFVA